MAVKQYQPTPDDLDSGIKHVCYEYANLMSSAFWSLHGQAPWRTNVDDAFLLGFRKLRDFLLRDARSQIDDRELPDILALDYLPAGAARSWDLPIWEAQWKGPMDKQLAHLTFRRDWVWNHTKWIPKLEQEMREAWSRFLGAAAPETKVKFHAELELCRRKPGFARIVL